MSQPMVRHRVVTAVEDAPVGPEDGIDPGTYATAVWYVSGRGVCRPAVYHFDELARRWVRGAACESVVDGGVFVQPTWHGRVELRLVHLKFDDDDGAPWTVNVRLT